MRCVIILLLLVIVTTATAQKKIAQVSDLHFMTGTWITTHAWGNMTEAWSDTAGNNLMCTFRCVDAGKLVFYEFITVEQESTGPVMYLRHYGPGSIGWEEKDKPYRYPLASVTKTKAVFTSPDGVTKLIYERVSPQKLVAVLEKIDEKGVLHRDEFNYSRSK